MSDTPTPSSDLFPSPQPEPPVVPHEEVPWGDVTIAVYREDRHTGYSIDGRRWMVEYDDSVPNPDGAVCNALQTNGTLCRLWRDHWLDKVPHMEFDAQLVAISGIYILCVESPDTVTP